MMDSMSDKERRRQELEVALHERGDFLEIRPDSIRCSQFINGEIPASHLEEIVDTMDEMYFFHNRTSYSRILRSLRTEQRGLDRFTENRAYCRRQYRNESSDESDSEEEGQEEHRREIAKRKALTSWIRKNPFLQHLPRTLVPNFK
jgi:hypothetical protein